MRRESKIRCCPEDLIKTPASNLKILDCTIRDGGLCNQWQFSHAFVKEVFTALCAAGVDYMEIGYRRTHEEDAKLGPWRFCDEEELRKVVQPGQLKLSR